MLFTTESTETQWPRLIKIKNRKRKSKQKRGSHDTYYYKTDLQGKNIIKDEEIFRLNQTQQQKETMHWKAQKHPKRSECI